MTELLPILMFVCLFGLILLGFPVAFTLAGTAILFGLLGHSLDLFYLSDFGFIPARLFGIMQNTTLMAVPLFVFMGIMLEKSNLAADLLESIAALFSKLSGGLAIAVIIVGALLAASTGIVGATVITMGVLSLPTMLKAGYDKKLATGVICASGTLGQIIPPSIVLIILGDMMNVDVGDLFSGALIPGLLLVFLYIIYVWIKTRLNPSLAPATKIELGAESTNLNKKIIGSLLPIGGLIVLVLGTILFGIASPTEAAACGAFFAIIITFLKKRFSREILMATMEQSAKITAMVFLILIGAQFFGVVFRGLAGDELIAEGIKVLNLSPAFVLCVILLLLFCLGFFLDFIEICFIVVPIVSPILTQLGFNPLWLAIVFALNLQTSFLTPPFGFALFYLKGVAPQGVKTSDIYRGIIPFVIIQLLALFIICLFPNLVLWLPTQIFQ